jgi:branched-chain amino acid aminotransferase
VDLKWRVGWLRQGDAALTASRISVMDGEETFAHEKILRNAHLLTGMNDDMAGGKSDFGSGAAYVNGRFVPVEQASISILDWGLLHSDATYDVAHVRQGAFFRLDDHMDRFERGMASLRMSLPLTRSEMREILFECVRLSALQDAYVEMMCTRGVPPAGSRDPRDAKNRFYAFAIPFVWIVSPEKQEEGINIVVSGIRRIAPEAVDPRVKNYHWLDFVSGLFEAYDRGGETAVLIDAAGHVLEGPGFNLFVVSGGRMATPDRGVLEGITRRTVMEIAQDMGVAVEKRPVTADELRHAGEAFMTSTAGGIMPIARVDGSPLGKGKPGSMTRQVRERYWALHSDPRYATPVPYAGSFQGRVVPEA